jgi:hypothetical protein
LRGRSCRSLGRIAKANSKTAIDELKREAGRAIHALYQRMRRRRGQEKEALRQISLEKTKGCRRTRLPPVD